MTKAKSTKAAAVSQGSYLRNPTALRKARAEKPTLNQASMAKDLEIALSSYGGIERGDIPVSKERAEKIAKLVGKSVKVLFKTHKSDKTKFVAV